LLLQSRFSTVLRLRRTVGSTLERAARALAGLRSVKALEQSDVPGDTAPASSIATATAWWEERWDHRCRRVVRMGRAYADQDGVSE